MKETFEPNDSYLCKDKEEMRELIEYARKSGVPLGALTSGKLFTRYPVLNFEPDLKRLVQMTNDIEDETEITRSQFLSKCDAWREQSQPEAPKSGMDRVEIYRFQLEAIYDALRLTANSYGCRGLKTCLDRQVAQAEKFALNALNGEIDKTERYGVSGKEGNTNG